MVVALLSRCNRARELSRRRLQRRPWPRRRLVALRVDGRWVGAPQRAPSYPVNPWEYPVSRTDRNYSYFVPVTPAMLDKTCEVVVLGFDSKNLDFKPDVWLTAYPVPYQAKTLTLSE